MRTNNYNKSDKNEFYPTPFWVKKELYKMIPTNTKTILDPCCGDGGLDFLPDYDYTLFDIVDHNVNAKICDFLKEKPTQKYDCVVMNPPFGQVNEFVKKAFEFSDYILLISPIRSFIKSEFGKHIKNYYFNWRIPYEGFGVLVSIGLFLLDKNNIYENNFGERLPIEKTFASTYYKTKTAPIDKWFIVNRITKARALRNEELISKNDLYAPGDDLAFIAQNSSINTKKGDYISRYIKEFDSKEDALRYINNFKLKETYIREYIYLWGNTVLDPKNIPDIY